MTAPYELIAAPFSVYIAPVGEPFPALDDDPPGGDWALLGASGHQSITHEGVMVAHESAYTSAPFVLPGATAPSRMARTSENLTVSFVLADLTAETYAKALNGSTVTDTAPGVGTAGYCSVSLLNASSVQEFALLIRGEVTPYLAEGRSQYELPRVMQTAPPMPLFVKQEPAGLLFRFRALRDETLGFGSLQLQDAAPTA